MLLMFIPRTVAGMLYWFIKIGLVVYLLNRPAVTTLEDIQNINVDKVLNQIERAETYIKENSLRQKSKDTKKKIKKIKETLTKKVEELSDSIGTVAKYSYIMHGYGKKIGAGFRIGTTYLKKGYNNTTDFFDIDSKFEIDEEQLKKDWEIWRKDYSKEWDNKVNGIKNKIKSLKDKINSLGLINDLKNKFKW